MNTQQSEDQEDQNKGLTEEQQEALNKFRINIEAAIDAATQRVIKSQEIDFHPGTSVKVNGKTQMKHIMKVESSSTAKIKSESGEPFPSSFMYILEAKIDPAGTWRSDPEFAAKLDHALRVFEEGETPVLSRLTPSQRHSMALVFRQMLERIDHELIDPSRRKYWLNEMMGKIRSIMMESSDPLARKKAEERNRRFESMALQRGDLVHASKLKPEILNQGMFAGEVLSGTLDNESHFMGSFTSQETTFFLDFYSISDSHQDMERLNRQLHVADFPTPDNDSVAYVIRPDAVHLPDDEVVTPHNFLLKPKGRLIYNFPTSANEEHVATYIGMPSTNICGMVLGGELVKNIDKIKKAMAKNFWYIPLFDCDMKPLFTYEEYLLLRNSVVKPSE